MIIVYGIKNCDAVKKARKWLDTNGVAYRFHDYKIAGIDPVRLTKWVEALGWETLLNRSGTTFRKLREASAGELDCDKAITIMLDHPSAIRRPIVEYPGGLLAGFAPERYSQALL